MTRIPPSPVDIMTKVTVTNEMCLGIWNVGQSCPKEARRWAEALLSWALGVRGSSWNKFLGR